MKSARPIITHSLLGRLYHFISACISCIFHSIVYNFWKMPKNWSIGGNRYVSVKKQGGDLHVTIAEEGSDTKSATFPSRRWAEFVRCIDEITENVNGLIAKQYVQLIRPIGGKWYVSVTTGFACVNIRQYYYNYEMKGQRPSKQGIALRLREWNALKDVIPQLHQKYPALSTAQPCSTQLDHQNLEGALSCNECHPFQYDELFHSIST